MARRRVGEGGFDESEESEPPETGDEKNRRLRDGAESDPMDPQTEAFDQKLERAKREGTVSDDRPSDDDEPEQDEPPDRQRSGSDPMGGPETSSSTPDSPPERNDERSESKPANAPDPSTGEPQTIDDPTTVADEGAGGDGGTVEPADTPGEQRFDPETDDIAPEEQGVEKHGSKEQQVQYQDEKVSLREAARRFELEAAERAGTSPEDTAVVVSERSGETVSFDLVYTESGEANAAASALREEYGVGEDVISTEGNEVVIDTERLDAETTTDTEARRINAMRAREEAATSDGSEEVSNRVNETLGSARAVASEREEKTSKSSGLNKRVSEAVAEAERKWNVDVPGDGAIFGEADTGASDELTQSGGALTEEQEAKVQRAEEKVSEFAADVGQFTRGVATYGPDDVLGRPAPSNRTNPMFGAIGEGVGRGTVEILNLPRYAGAGETATEVAQNAPDASQEDLEAAAAVGGLTLAGAAASAASNPGRTFGALVGSGAVAGGTFSAAQAVGPRTGLAARTLLQPGEELAKGAARKGIVSNRVARLVPGVREGQHGMRGESAKSETATDRPQTTDPNLPEERPYPLESKAVDEARGVSGPSTRSKIRGRVERSQLAQRIGQARARAVEELTGQSRGQADLTGRQRPRSETEPSIEEDRVSDNLYQQAIERRQMQDFRNMGRGGVESESEAFTEGERARRQREADALRKRAEEPQARMDETELENSNPFAGPVGSGAAATSLNVADAQRPTVDERTDPLAGLADRADTSPIERSDTSPIGGIASRSDVARDVGLDVAQERELERERERELEREREIESAIESELGIEREREAERETAIELESETERDIFEPIGDRRDRNRRDRGFAGSERSVINRLYSPLEGIDASGGDDLSGLAEDLGLSQSKKSRSKSFFDPL